MLQILDDDNDEQEDEKRPELVPIEQLMDYFIFELSSRNNFEFLQAVIRLFLKVCHISPWPVQLFIEVQRNVIYFFLIAYLLCFFILLDTWRDNSAT